ncbi:G-type lectin S-receptor-like serine/threonine-protein kinase At4g27290 [Ziziphus jujuba]|uniref:Receptor-like serine/threonine-protein kinase n=1 Tax=Ziziphus jujuba TaxID=326968 RepID=A0A6P4AI51_ZIZJJ|nr:G-type lectin S-receptor-like serine/threonine-protein kinase At4g27290 [Ziziphus jujuba]
MENLLSLFLTTFTLVSFFKTASAVDLIAQTHSISDGKSSLVSKGGSFKLGFFSPGKSKNRYLGIWYNNIREETVVWVANRDKPINDSSGILKMNTTGSNFVLLGQNNNSVFWSTNSSKQAQSPILQLLDSGNLVLRDEKDENAQNYLWQSFDYPCDTLLPGMKLGWDLRTGLNRRLTSWKSEDDPSPGDLTWEMELHSFPEPVMWMGSKEFLRSGPWNGIQFSGKPTKSLPLLKFSFISNEDEVYTIIHMVNNSLIGRMVLNRTSSRSLRQFLIWSETDKKWTLYAGFPRDQCDSYGICGANGNCVLSASPFCQCLERFRPKLEEKWNTNDWSDGCVRNKPLKYCQINDRFAKYEGLKLPDTTHTWINRSMNLKECRAKCLSNCTCMAYTNTDVREGGSGCAIWFGDLIDIKQIPGGGQYLYVRVSASELEAKDEKWMVGVIVAAAAALILVMLLVGYYIWRRRRTDFEGEGNEGQKEDMELPSFDLSVIASATDNFSLSNKLGEGGFGPVYKGRLADGQEIAVKRLSRTSGQGLRELKNEVILIAKLQHRNLVRLLGCCIQGAENLLIYEFMPNKSLDFFIFDQTRGKLLDWPKRFNIIGGVARGLLYLHQDSRLRIIHRDLKASNVLLDTGLNPKISDFGLARTFGGDETEGNTNRVVGTYGYMAPEYAIDGQFSIKSDVFSFGILMLEIISGKRSKGFYHMNQSLNLIGHAWRLWKEGRPLELIDENIGDSCIESEVLRSIQISLLCMQLRPEDRPTMSSVVQMLGSERPLPQPTEPGFCLGQNTGDSASTTQPPSANEVTITLLEGR